MSDSLRPHGHIRLHCPSPTPTACTHSCPLSGDTTKPSHPLSSPSSPAFNLSQHLESFPMSQFFTSDGQSIGVSASASVLPIQSFKRFISHSSFLLERPNYTSGIRATRPEHCGPTQSVEVCHHKEPLTFCTGFNPSQKACVTVPQILLCF